MQDAQLIPPEIPPRVRGREPFQRFRPTQQGNTPACAGKSLQRFGGHTMMWKYPRVCGEETSTANLAAMRERIPPRVRGRDPLDQAEGLDLGNTPACAGKSWSSFKKLPRVGNTPACAGKRARKLATPSSRWKYPRVCGEESVLDNPALRI